MDTKLKVDREKTRKMLERLRQMNNDKTNKDSGKPNNDKAPAKDPELKILQEAQPFSILLTTKELLEDCRILSWHRFALHVLCSEGRLLLPKHAIAYYILAEPQTGA